MGVEAYSVNHLISSDQPEVEPLKFEFIFVDIGGFNIYNQLRSKMITGKELFVFIYDATNIESFEYLQQQMQEVLDQNNGQMSGLVVSNKMDLEDVVRVDPKDG